MQIFYEHVSVQPLIRKHSDLDHIRKHSDLDHRNMGRFNFVWWHHTSGSFPVGGARGQKLVHFKHTSMIYRFCMSTLESIDSWTKDNQEVPMASDPRVHASCELEGQKVKF